MITAWHFRDAPDRLRDGTPSVAGQVETYDSPLVMCKSGLHASRRAIDALRYAPGPYVALVECDGKVIEQGDKLVCARRRPLWIADAEGVLRWFARQCARDVLHLWTSPIPEAVRCWLDEEDLSEAARGAAESAAESAAGSAARGAAWSAAGSAAGSAARGAAENAAREKQNQVLESLLMELAK